MTCDTQLFYTNKVYNAHNHFLPFYHWWKNIHSSNSLLTNFSLASMQGGRPNQKICQGVCSIAFMAKYVPNLSKQALNMCFNFMASTDAMANICLHLDFNTSLLAVLKIWASAINPSAFEWVSQHHSAGLKVKKWPQAATLSFELPVIPRLLQHTSS